MIDWEMDMRDIGECLTAWEKQHGLKEEDAALEFRLTKQTYRRIKREQHLVSEQWLRRMMCLIDLVGTDQEREEQAMACR